MKWKMEWDDPDLCWYIGEADGDCYTIKVWEPRPLRSARALRKASEPLARRVVEALERGAP